MNTFLNDFFNRIQYEKQDVTFEDICTLQSQFAKHIPFENMSIIQNENVHITFEDVKRKIIDNRRGGVCYELNPLFYYALKELGFDVHLIGGTVFSNEENWLIQTHFATILHHNGQRYLIDVGFGSHHALQPLPFTGETITSPTGIYRIQKKETTFGEYSFEKYQDGKLEIGYDFFLARIDETALQNAKQIITHHEKSPFNKSPLLTKRTDDGHITLTDKTYTVIKEKQKSKQTIDTQTFRALALREFGIAIQ
ncbi:arylamine N-acetyltransferase [Bacillus sp. JJ864]|uniref:arylamine N-acetyltransferase family protein n=1 Tax=Bacillus sp. JJ864 TaxID=3122975 RepID=UPI002FFF2C3A